MAEALGACFKLSRGRAYYEVYCTSSGDLVSSATGDVSLRMAMVIFHRRYRQV